MKTQDINCRRMAMLDVGLITGPTVIQLERAVCKAHGKDGLVHRLLLECRLCGRLV